MTPSELEFHQLALKQQIAEDIKFNPSNAAALKQIEKQLLARLQSNKNATAEHTK